MRKFLLALGLLVAMATSAVAYVSVQIGVPVATIGINVPVYPQFVRVPGYPVYYAPRVHANYFFYDGLYWVYRRGNWYTSYWYNGPWSVVDADSVPLYVLRVPVRYYYDRPAIFASWYDYEPPRWVEIWGSDWGARHSGWDRWNRSAVPAAAPLPVYQRQYTGNRYPQAGQQAVLQTRNYRYQPRDTVARQIYQTRVTQPAMAAVTTRAPQTRQQALQARMAPQQSRIVQQQTVQRNEARARQHEARVMRSQEFRAASEAKARQHEARVMRSQEFRAASRPQELRAMRQAHEPRAAAQPREFRAMRQRPEQMTIQQAPPPREARAMRQGPERMAMRPEHQPKEMKIHEPKGGPGPGGGGHGGEPHGGKDKGPKGGKG